MKILLLTGLLITANGCSLLSGAKDALSTSYEVGKARGRAEVLQEINENKKKIQAIKELLILKLSEALAGEYKKEQLKELIPILTGATLLLNNQGKLLDELKNATSSESAGE